MKLAALVLMAALNPLVVRSPVAHGTIPADCEVSDAPAMARVNVPDAQEAQADDPATPLPPVRPRATDYDLRALQNALATNNRPLFDAELERARAAGAPTRVYEDVQRLWNAQYESPFFAEGSEPHRIASQYSGYEAAVREQIFTDAAGRKFYPAAESRAFVAKQTGAKIASTTRTQTQSTRSQSQSTRSQSTSPAQTNASRSTTKRSTTTTSTRPSTTRPSSTNSSSPKKNVVSRTTQPPSSSPDPSPAKRPSATASAPVVPAAGNTSPVPAPPAAGSLPTDTAVATTTTAIDTMPVDTATTDTATTGSIATDTTATTPSETTTTAATGTTSSAQPARRSIVLPAILILIGVAVLILLFRAK